MSVEARLFKRLVVALTIGAVALTGCGGSPHHMVSDLHAVAARACSADKAYGCHYLANEKGIVVTGTDGKPLILEGGANMAMDACRDHVRGGCDWLVDYAGMTHKQAEARSNF